MRGARVKLAYVLLGAGILLFAAQSGLLGALPSFLWLSLLFVLGAAFWLGTPDSLSRWQRVGGFALIGVVAAVSADRFEDAALAGFPALALGLNYLLKPGRWWSLIPAGLLGSLALMFTFEGLFPRWDATPVLFLGVAGTFTLLYLLSPQRGGKRWAIYPAILFITLTVLVNDPSGAIPGWFLPILLIGGGSILLWWWKR